MRIGNRNQGFDLGFFLIIAYGDTWCFRLRRREPALDNVGAEIGVNVQTGRRNVDGRELLIMDRRSQSVHSNAILLVQKRRRA
jgi:hypothetical protein